VIDVLATLLAFAKTYSPLKAHNMMAIMFDSRHKNMKTIKEYVGDSFASTIVQKYD
jgi:CO/xanthine dehydrogenase Mo-binding subunit